VLTAVIAAVIFQFLNLTSAQVASETKNTNDAIARIIDEGMNHSLAMTNLSYLSDVIGPRLTGSPNLKRANEWTRDKLASWGLTNAHLEAWGPFGRGWTLKEFSAQVIEPQTFPLIACPNAWSPGFGQPLVADVVYMDVHTNADLEKFKGKLKGAIVLAGPMREVKARFEPMAKRLVETNLLELANAGVPRDGRARFQSPDTLGGTNAGPGGGPGGSGRRPRFSQQRFLSFMAREGAALIVNESSLGDGGTVFVAAASVPRPESETTNSGPAGGFGFPTNLIRVWATNAPAIPPQITVAAEDYNRMARMIEQGAKLKMAVDLKVKFNEDDLMAYNTIAEIPGSDLKDEIVMLGGHLDSWHSGTGATDNGAGVAATMEAVRIITALNLHPRRTIRIALWSGEEQGLYGSKAYVAEHFGYFTNETKAASAIRSPKDAGSDDSIARTNVEPVRRLVRGPEYEKLSVYFNLDNGAGKIRGVYMQGNEGLRPLFRRWLEPFRDLGAETLTPSNTGSTDHISFDTIGLTGLEFLQDPLDYSTRSHHSNEDVFDRIQADDLKQAAVIIAAFVYDAAMADEKLPRKPLVENPPRRNRPVLD